MIQNWVFRYKDKSKGNSGVIVLNMPGVFVSLERTFDCN